MLTGGAAATGCRLSYYGHVEANAGSIAPAQAQEGAEPSTTEGKEAGT